MKNTNKANETNFPTNGNCKRVKDLTTGKEYGSITETAITLGVTGQAVSTAIKKETLCKGHRLVLVKDLHDSIEVICEESAKANARANRAEAKLSEIETEMAEFRKWKAEQEAKRKAEEKMRKEEEKRQALISKAKEKIAKYTTDREKVSTQLQKIDDKLLMAETELATLMAKEVM